jgi:hypothetical protein
MRRGRFYRPAFDAASFIVLEIRLTARAADYLVRAEAFQRF